MATYKIRRVDDAGSRESRSAVAAGSSGGRVQYDSEDQAQVDFPFERPRRLEADT